MVYYGQDYMLEDRSGQLTGSDFEDVNGRIRLTLRCTQATSAHASYMIFDRTHSDVYDFNNPLAVLDFGPNNTLGTVAFENTPHVPMKEYLTKVVVASGALTRKFTAQDGQEYFWSWKIKPEQEWTCTNANGYHVASYTLKLSSEPEYEESSGCMLTVEEAYPHLIAEMLASVTIMRHIVEHKLY